MKYGGRVSEISTIKIQLFNMTSIDHPSIAIQYDKNIQENGAEIVLFRKLFDMDLFTES